MSRNPTPSDDSWESDAVWMLLDQATPTVASPGFSDAVLRAVRLEEVHTPWWRKILSPAPLAGFAVATAAVTFAIISLVNVGNPADSRVAVLDSPEAVAIQDIAETEALIAAADQLDDFSDTELVRLIGF